MVKNTKDSAFGEAIRLNQPESIVQKYDYNMITITKYLASQKAIRLNQLESTFSEP